MKPIPEPASFRDPDSRVWMHEGRILRSVDRDTVDAVGRLEKEGWLSKQVTSGRLVKSKLLDRAEWPGALPDSAQGVLEHDRLPVVSYPYEWSFSMLADAGILHLELQEELLGLGLSLKDASAFNVLFDRFKPCFIDYGSFEKPVQFSAWYAYGQFCRMFLFPLLLKLHRGLPIAGLFLPALDGVDINTCYRCLGPARSWSLPCFLDVGLQHALQRGDSGKSMDGNKPAKPAAAGDPEVQKVNLRRLRRKLEKLKQAYQPSGLWSEYRKTHSYSDVAEKSKQVFVEKILSAERPEWVLDVGCNTGTYSRIAAALGSRVIATDLDHDSIECLYRELQEKPANIYPLVANVATPSPASGHLGEERKGLLDRIQADAVLGLAVVHHLLVSARLPLAMIVDLFARLSRKLVIVEYVDPSDEMFQKLLARRTDDFSGLTLDAFRTAMGARFKEIALEEVKPGKRWLYAGRRLS